MERIFLAIVGVVYILLAAWCSLSPEKTSKTVGLEIQPGQGQSEFLTVYGGLELGLGLIFLWPLYRPEEVVFPLLVCLILHACLVVFRTAGFLLYSGFTNSSYMFAASEWIIFLGAALLYGWKSD